MRLTLRTLLAWLDDTLQPTQVREIGVQVAESPFAQELTERIHRVTRQRRLSVPSSSGADGTDPNTVASYLDNDLDAEEVAEYEKKCLTSDVKLAEVASVHQILSLLGQKVKVPTEAKARMYQLVRGRETVRARPAKDKKDLTPEPVTRPIQAWVAPETNRRSWVERFGILAATLALVASVIVTASWSLHNPASDSPLPSAAEMNIAANLALPPREDLRQPAPGEPDVLEPVADADRGTAVSEKGAAVRDDNPTSVAAKTAEVKVAKDTNTKPSGTTDGIAAVVPAGSAGLAVPGAGVLLRYNADQREWDRLSGATPLSRSDRVLCLSPFRATVILGNIPLSLVGETEIRILSQPTDKIPAFELIQGRVLVRNAPSASLRVGSPDRLVTVDVSPASAVGIERSDRREYGRTVNQPSPLTLFCTQGEVGLTADQKHETLTASDAAVIDAAGAVQRTEIDTLPPWATNAEPTPDEIKLQEKFVRLFHPGRPVLTEIVAASEDDDPDVKTLSIRALKSLGDLSLLMPMLSRAGDRLTRTSALEAIRGYLGLSRDASLRVREQLGEEFGDDTTAFVEKMLIGYPAEEASNSQLYERLVAALGPEQPSIGVRELAIDNLKRLTGRDDLGYDPDQPDGKGLTAWKDLQRQGKLRSSAPKSAPKK
jgi:hypothetical protein